MIVIVVFLILIAIALSILMNLLRKVQEFVSYIKRICIWSFATFYVFAYFSELFYINEFQYKTFWTDTAIMIINSTYHYYIITLLTLFVTQRQLQLNLYTTDLEALVILQLSYFIFKLPQFPTNLIFFYSTFQVILLFIQIIYSEYPRNLFICILTTLTTCTLFTYLNLNFLLFWRYFCDYIFWNSIMFFTTYFYIWVICGYIYILSYYFPEFKIRLNTKKIWLYNTQYLYLFFLPIISIFSFIYQIIMEYTYGSTISLISPLIVLSHTVPAAYLMSIHFGKENLNSIWQNLAALTFTTYGAKLIFF